MVVPQARLRHRGYLKIRMKKQGSNKAGRQMSAASDASTATQQARAPTPSSSTATSDLPPRSLPALQPSTACKLPIPRLRLRSEDRLKSKSSLSEDKSRVGHACEQCRQRKTKCNGERPACQHCRDLRLKCVYVDAKRDKTKK